MNDQQLFDLMVRSGMNDVVGGGDPKSVGEENTRLINRFADLRPGMKVLDFGCGCGRVAIPVLHHIGPGGQLVGVDIIPDMIRFCRDQITPVYQNTRFYHLTDKNIHYSRWTTQSNQTLDTITQIADLEEEKFDLIFAFSVFTHLNLYDTRTYLRQLADLLSPNGRLIISMFFINATSRRGIKEKYSNTPFDNRVFDDRPIHFGNTLDPLGAVGFQETQFIKMVDEAGLEMEQIYYGSWSGRPHRESGQDVTVLVPASRLPAGFDATKYLELNADIEVGPDATEGRTTARRHYLFWGSKEGRRWK